MHLIKNGVNLKITVASALDNNYTMPTVVMICSLLENVSEETVYEIFLLVPNNYEEENKNNFYNLIKNYPKHHISFIDMGYEFENEHVPIAHVTYPTYYRLLLPHLLCDCDKCIYLDGDMLILGDLRELYAEDIDDYYVAGVKSPSYCMTSKIREENIRRLSLSSMDQYINAGVMLMNLKKMREVSMEDDFMDMLEQNRGQTNDQDIINVQCFGFIKTLPFRFNYQLEASAMGNAALQKVFSDYEMIKNNESPLIIHYSSSSVKPWKSLEYRFSNLWWEYFRKTLYGEKELWYKQKIEMDRKEKYTEFIKKKDVLYQQNNIVLFGYSVVSLELLNKLTADGFTVTGFCDNDKQKQGLKECGLEVYSLENCFQKFDDIFFINTSQNHAEEINQQLISAGVRGDKIMEYVRKGYWLDFLRKEDMPDIYL